MRMTVTALVVSIGVLLVLPVAAAQDDEAAMLEKVKRLQEEGTEQFNIAGNTDLSRGQRNKALKAAYIALREAQNILDEFVGEDPKRIERYDDRMCEIHKLLFWIRKESPMNLLPQEEELEAENPWKDIPKPKDLDEPALGPKPRPGPGPKPGPGPAPAPEAALPPTPAQLFKKAEDFEKSHPWDIGGALVRYREFMARHPDPDSPLFKKALERCSLLNGRLKDAYRQLRQEDPDALDPKRMLSASEKVLLLRLTRDLKSKNEEERRRAALDLGLLGTGDGSYHLVKLLRTEKADVVIAALCEAIVKIGGKKATEFLESTFRSVRKEPQLLMAIDLLEKIGVKDPVQGRYAGIALGKFIHSGSAAAGQAAFDATKGLGTNGGVDGLCSALLVRKVPIGRRLLLIEALGDLGDPRAARVLGRFLVQKGDRQLKDTSIKVLKKLGVEVVPHLIPFLKSPSTRLWTGHALRQITGVQMASTPRLWAEWWMRHQASQGIQGR
jgi:HEAT repeat protein